MMLKSVDRTVLHIFHGSDAASGIAVHPISRDIYFTARALYRLDAKAARYAESTSMV
jgi:hypothetical protein